MTVLRELDFFSLTVFKGIYDTGQAALAAKSLNVAAPKISRCLNNMRKLFDDEIFYRCHSGLMPTPKAEVLYPSVNQLIDKFEQLQQLSKNSYQLPKVSIAVLPQVLPVLGRKLQLSEFADLAKQLDIRPLEESSLSELRVGELDIVISATPAQYNNFEVSRINYKPQAYLVASEAHPIWQRQQQFELPDLARFPFIYFILKGFNERIDPIEAFFINNRIGYVGAQGFATRDQWYAKLITSQATSICGAIAVDSIAQMPGIKVWPLPDSELSQLHQSQDWPIVNFIEREPTYQRYDQQTKQQIHTLLTSLFL